jgi:hypothetical protein
MNRDYLRGLTDGFAAGVVLFFVLDIIVVWLITR